jgi:hypothetical protein
VVVDKKTKKVICTSFSNGKKHDFKLFKESKVRWTKEHSGVTDSGYTGIKKFQKNSRLPKKSNKKKPLTKEERKENQKISSETVVNENVIGSLKKFKIISDRYRNRRKRFGLRFNLIAKIHNYEVLINAEAGSRRDGEKTKVICTSFSNGKKHDFRLFKESHVRWTKERRVITDSGYIGIKKLQGNTKLPKKSSKKTSNSRGKSPKSTNFLRESG